jgi:oligopeptide/dipeptide ABC transporter ATP-binding protein
MSDLGAELIAQAEKNKALMASFGKELELLATAEEPVVAATAERNGGPEFILEFRDVTKEFPITAGAILRRKIGALHAVTELQLGIRPGETFGLVGESGCGKTTLGRMGVGLEVPTSGQVLFDGTDLASVKGAKFRELRRDLQFMFQDPYASLDPRMRVKEIISEPLDIAGIGTPKERAEKVRSALDEVGLGYDTADRYPHEFSGGQRQRIGIARALAVEPEFIVCDEPTSSLDVSIQAQIVNLLVELQETMGIAYLFVSHDLTIVEHVSHRVAVMYLGKIVEQASAAALYEQPRHPYTRALLAAAPVPDPERKRFRLLLAGDAPSPMDPPPGCAFHPRCERAIPGTCDREVPRLEETAQGSGHRVACWNPHKD